MLEELGAISQRQGVSICLFIQWELTNGGIFRNGIFQGFEFCSLILFGGSKELFINPSNLHVKEGFEVVSFVSGNITLFGLG